MTRKHFVAIAEAIHEQITDPEENEALVALLSPIFQELNPRFDRERFRRACRPDEAESGTA